MKLLSRVRLFASPWTTVLPGSSIHGIFPGKSPGVGCHFLLQEIFPIQGSNSSLLHCRQILYQLHQISRVNITQWKIDHLKSGKLILEKSPKRLRKILKETQVDFEANTCLFTSIPSKTIPRSL